ncbi:mitochondrial carrier [Crucibulum laeve]|uniref:Mitochondrial carrier n=1 Tax=Crucibulum laeve TaxID=68775 RepID=A0A5C3MDD5_9AGAR|nr:mitochondrial carrier [Crucibulum laeve]
MPPDNNNTTNNTPYGPDDTQGDSERLPPPLDRPYIPPLRSDPPFRRQPHSLLEFREAEGNENRKRRLHDLWIRLQNSRAAHSNSTVQSAAGDDVHGAWNKDGLTPERARSLNVMYDDELFGYCKGHSSGSQPGHIGWQEFKEYAKAKEVELWQIFHDELDLDGDGRLDAHELQHALSKAGIELSPGTMSEFMATLTSSAHSRDVTFYDFRDFLLLLPRKASPAEIYRYYEVRKFMGDDGRGAARVNMEGDVSLSAEDKPPDLSTLKSSNMGASGSGLQYLSMEDEDEDDDDMYFEDEPEEEHHHFLEGHTAIKFLLAGGIAGAVSRTCTAPFDRLKIFLITRPPDLGGATLLPKPGITGVKIIGNAVARIYAEGGVLAFWTGNGLSVAKIFPESAIKFFAYESSKRAFAKYWDKVEDPREISGVSRFLSGGIGGISSQLSIYPIETLKTQMMSNTGQHKRTLLSAARHVWSLGGVRAYYRGLTIGLVGVFPYSAIDMSTFEALKLAYLRSTGKEEPGVMALLAFGSVSGSVGATSVYPLNLVRTRLQASGSSGHPQRYTGVWDVAAKTWERDGWRGFYRGLFPTLAKVVPAVSISYVVYEHSKRKLGV